MARTRGAKDTKPRKPRSPNKKKDDEAAASAGPADAKPGHNTETGQPSVPTTAGLTDDQRAKLYFAHKATILGLRSQLQSTNSDLQNAFKALKADTGITRAEFDRIQQAAKDDVKAKDAHRRFMDMARWELLPIGTQPDMLDEVDRTPLVDRAGAEGKKAGLAGDPCKPPYDGEAGQKWIAGWHDGQAVKVMEGIKPLDPNQGTLIPADRPDAAPTMSNSGFDADPEPPAAEADGGQANPSAEMSPYDLGYRDKMEGKCSPPAPSGDEFDEYMRGWYRARDAMNARGAPEQTGKEDGEGFYDSAAGRKETVTA